MASRIGAALVLSLAVAHEARAQDDALDDAEAPAITRPARAETRILQLIDQLRDDDRWKARVEAAVILGRSGDIRARQPLTRALTDPHYAVRAAAIRSLTNIADIRAIRALLDCLGDDEPFVRSEARRAIDSFDLEIARPYFVHALRRHPDPNVRLASAERLAEAPDEASLFALLDAIGGDDEVARFAASALRARPEPEAIELFLRGLGEVDYAVQIASMKALADLATPRATDPLIALLDSEVPEVTIAAAEALRALAVHVDRSKWLVLAKRAPSRFERARALKVLGIVGGEEAAVLVLNALDDDDVLVRGAAVNAVANLQELRAIPKLEEMKKLEVNGRILSLVRTTLSNLQRLRERGKSDAKQPS
ncbi:HEAT repeat domain-containing protein [Myxococcota bacterium]|nr:HEAT repeat domain-containing protein [Myxococcota bacterium]